MKESTKNKIARLNQKAKDNAPVLITAASTVVGAAGWIVAGIYARKIDRLLQVLETVDDDEWPVVRISPGAHKDLRNGSVLMIRQFEVEPNHIHTQHTTLPEGFPAEADEFFNKHAKKAGMTIENTEE